MWGRIFAPIIDRAIQDQLDDLRKRLDKQNEIIMYLIESIRELTDAVDAICQGLGVYDEEDTIKDIKDKLPPRLQVVVDNDKSKSSS